MTRRRPSRDAMRLPAACQVECIEDSAILWRHRTRHHPAHARASNTVTPNNQAETIHGRTASTVAVLDAFADVGVFLISIGSRTSILPFNLDCEDAAAASPPGSGGFTSAAGATTPDSIVVIAPQAMTYRTEAA